MKTRIYNKFHNFSKTLKHRGTFPSVCALRRALRESKPKDCQSTTIALREDGWYLSLENRGRGIEVFGAGQTEAPDTSKW